MYSFFYMAVLIVIGPYFAVQLFLVILSTECADVTDEPSKRMHKMSKRKLNNALKNSQPINHEKVSARARERERESESDWDRVRACCGAPSF